MELLTARQRKALLTNRRNRDQDYPPVVKFFNPCGASMWLCSELDPEDGDTLFGLADDGHGFPELGYFSLMEIAAIRVSFGLRIERDVHFEPTHPLSVYAEAARTAGRIVEHDTALESAKSLLHCAPARR